MTDFPVDPDPLGPEPRASRARRRGRAWLRSLVIALSAGLLVVVGGMVALTFFFRAGNPYLAGQVLAALNRAVGTDSTRFVSDRIHGTIYRGAILDHPKLLVRTADGEVTWASAQDLRVDLDRPRLDLVHEKNGEWVLPRFAQRKEGGARKQETRVSISIRNGSFTMDRNDVRFGGIGGHATLTLGPGRSSLKIQDLSGSSERPGRPGKLDVSGEVLIENGLLRADPLEVTLGSSHLTAQVDWVLAEARVRDGSIALNPLRVREFFRSFEIESQDGVLTGEITFSGTPTSGQARACLEGTYAGEPIDTLVLIARSRPSAVDFTGFRFRVRQAEIVGGGTLDTRRSVLSAAVGFQKVNPAVLPWWKSPQNTPQGSLNGRARIEARRTKPRPSAAMAITLEPSRFGHLDIARGLVRLRIDPNGASAIDSSWLDLPGARLAGSARVGADRSLQASIAGDLRDLTRLNSLLGPLQAEAGSGRLSARLTGTTEKPAFRALAQLYGGRLTNGVSGDTVTVEAQGVLLPELSLTADVAVTGLRAGGRPLGSVSATVSGGRLLQIQRYRQALGDTVLALRGDVRFEKTSIEARIDSLILAAGEHGIRNRVPVHIVSSGGHVHVRDLSLLLDPGTLEADLDWNPARGTVDARGVLDGIDLNRLPDLKRKGMRIAGVAHGEFLASGPAEDPDVSLVLRMVEPTFGNISGDSLELEANYVPGALNIRRVRWTSGGSRAELSGVIRPSLKLAALGRALAKRETAWADRTPIAVEVATDSFDVGLLAPIDSSLRTLEGTVIARCRLSGTLGAPVIDLTGRGEKLRYRGVEAEIPTAALQYADRRLKIAAFEVRQDQDVSKVQGEIPLDLGLYAKDRTPENEPLSLSIQVPRGNLAIFPLLFPEIGMSSGHYAAGAEVSGTTRRPIVQGFLRVSDGKLRLAGREEVIGGIQLEATFDQERVTIAKAVGNQGKRGQLTASGWWKWPTAAPARSEPAGFGPRGEYEFHLKATDFTSTDGFTYLVRVTGSLDIRNARSAAGAVVPTIRGNLVIDKGELTLDLAKPPGGPKAPLPFLYYVNVNIPGNFFYRNLDAEVELESDGDLILKNEGDGDLALGILLVRGGKYYVLTRSFRNLDGTVNFNSPDRIDPEVNIVGETSLPGPTEPLTVYLALTDRVSRLKVRVYDEKGEYSSNELWKALAIGTIAPKAGLNAAGAGTTGAQPAGLASNYLFQNVERWIGSSGFIDTIDLRAPEAGEESATRTSPIGAVGVGKYVTPEFYFNYSHEFSGEADQQISADYRITRRILIRGQQIRRPNDPDPEKRLEHNLDLKVRLEY